MSKQSIRHRCDGCFFGRWRRRSRRIRRHRLAKRRVLRILWSEFRDQYCHEQQRRDFELHRRPRLRRHLPATTSLGSDPSVSLNVNEVTFQNTSGGFAEAELGYYVEYVNTPGTYTVVLHSGDTLSVPFSSSFPSAGQAYVGFGPAGSDTTSINNFNQIIFQDTDCVDGCRTGVGNFLSPMPLPTNQSVQMVANTPYFVQTWVTISPAPSGLQLSGMVDPTFTTNTGGTFIFSPASPASVLRAGAGDLGQMRLASRASASWGIARQRARFFRPPDKSAVSSAFGETASRRSLFLGGDGPSARRLKLHPRIVSETLSGSASKTCAASLNKAAAGDESKSSNLSKLKLLRPMRNSPRRPA